MKNNWTSTRDAPANMPKQRFKPGATTLNTETSMKEIFRFITGGRKKPTRDKWWRQSGDVYNDEANLSKVERRDFDHERTKELS